jgi:hypothetical protein
MRDMSALRRAASGELRGADHFPTVPFERGSARRIECIIRDEQPVTAVRIH